MNFKKTLADSVIKDITLIIRIREKSLMEAIAIVKSESCAGPAVWELVAEHYNINVSSI